MQNINHDRSININETVQTKQLDTSQPKLAIINSQNQLTIHRLNLYLVNRLCVSWLLSCTIFKTPSNSVQTVYTHSTMTSCDKSFEKPDGKTTCVRSPACKPSKCSEITDAYLTNTFILLLCVCTLVIHSKACSK